MGISQVISVIFGFTPTRLREVMLVSKMLDKYKAPSAILVVLDILAA
jgi:hypothetical protein